MRKSTCKRPGKPTVGGIRAAIKRIERELYAASKQVEAAGDKCKGLELARAADLLIEARACHLYRLR